MISISLSRAVIGSFFNTSSEKLKLRNSFSKLIMNKNRQTKYSFLISFFILALVKIILEFYDLNFISFYLSIKYLVFKYLVPCFIHCARAKNVGLFKPIINEILIGYLIYLSLIKILISWDSELNPQVPLIIHGKISLSYIGT